MNDTDRYEAWKRERATTDIPTGFADRVMSAIEEADKPRPATTLSALFSSGIGRAAIWLIACGVCLFRLWLMLAVFHV